MSGRLGVSGPIIIMACLIAASAMFTGSVLVAVLALLIAALGLTVPN